MLEFLFSVLPQSALACRRLYDVKTGGYHLPPRELNVPLEPSDVDRLRASHPDVVFDCIETPVADLLYALVVNTRSRWILETGTSRGFSTSHLAAGASFVDAESARVLTIDLAPTPHPFFEGTTLARHITAIRADSLALDLRPVLRDDRLDFIFFDSLHTYAHLSGELVRYLPFLKTGGLFALHDTLVYDDLGLVVTWLAASGLVEMVTLPTHRTHRDKARSPGVSLFRKIRRTDAGDLVFPDLSGVVDGERQSLVRPAQVVERTGSLFTDPRYVVGRLHCDGPRDDDCAPLLECVDALRERETPPTGAWLDRLDVLAAPQASTGSVVPTPLQRHAAVDVATAAARHAWWRLYGGLEQRLFRWLPDAFAPASQRRMFARLLDHVRGAAELVHFVTDAGDAPSPLQAAIGAAAGPTVRPLAIDAWRDGREQLPSAGAYLLHGALSALSSNEITALLARLDDAAPAGARIVVIEPVCFPGHVPDATARRLAASIADLVQTPGRVARREAVEFSPATREIRALLAKRWWGELPCGPAPLQRPFVGDELAHRLAQSFVLGPPETLQSTSAPELGAELLLLSDDAPALAQRLAGELLPALDELERALLARASLPDVSWYAALHLVVARGRDSSGR